MECPKCHSQNPDSAKFCNECGRHLTSALLSSPHALSTDEKVKRIQRYIPKSLTDRILAQKGKIEGELRQVTIMFCDMRGFTPLTEKLGPETTFSLMDQVFEILIHKVHENEGTVNELRGDGILALFGAPIALEDAPQKALRSALAIHQEIKIFNKNVGNGGKFPPILLRIGINTGPVVVGSLGNDLRVHFTAMGNTINMAARMEQMATPGTTYVTKETFKQTKAFFRFKALGKKFVKGKISAIPVYQVLSAKENVYRPRLGYERIIYSEMVGRGRELYTLEQQIKKLINGEGSIVNITGEAGIGKSRLIAELKKCDVMRNVAFLEGRAISIGKNLSFHPIIDLLKQWARIKSSDGETKAFSKLRAAVKSLYPKEYGEVLPFVAILMGMNLTEQYQERVKGIEGEALEKLIQKNARDLLSKAANLTPLVIVLEDLHWCDTSSIELIESLLRLTKSHRILHINVFRQGHKETGDRIAAMIKKNLPEGFVEIALEPLDESNSEELIYKILDPGGLHHTIIDQIIKRTGGNPFFIEEVVRSFIDEGAVVLKNGKFVVTEKIHKTSIPYTISDVLMSRIDRLDEKTRSLVKIASVIGRNFFYRILIGVAGTTADIESRLSYLKKIEIIRERKRMGEVEFLFKHTLAQETAYESILPPKRKDLHLKVARSIEVTFTDRLHEFYGMLAFHYSRADSPEKAEEYLIKAGEEALKSSASNEALHYYQQALDLYLKEYKVSVDPKKVAMIEKNIALALYNRGQYEDAIEYLDKALNYYWGELPKHAISAVIKFLSGFLHFLVSIYWPSLKFKKIPTRSDNEAIDLFFKKLKALAIIDPKTFFVESFYFYKRLTRYNLAKFESGIGMFVGASTLFSFTGTSFKLSKKILELVENEVDKDDIKSSTWYDFSETLHYYFKGDWKKIKEYDNILVDSNLSIGEIWGASQHFHWHGLPNIYRGNMEIASRLVNKLDEIYKEFQNDFSFLLRQLLKSCLLMECRRLPEALIQIDKGIEFGLKTSQGTILIEMYSRKAHIFMLMGDYKQAKIALALADRVRCEINTVPWQLTDFFRSQLEYDLFMLEKSINEGEQWKILENRKKAKRSAQKLLKVAKKVAQNRTDAYRLVGIYCWLTTRYEKAFKWWRKAIEEGERLGSDLELSRTYFEIGKHLLDNKCSQKVLYGIKATGYIDKARILFEKIDLKWDLEELDRWYVNSQLTTSESDAIG